MAFNGAFWTFHSKVPQRDRKEKTVKMDKIIEYVRNFANMVAEYAKAQVSANRSQRLQRAFQTISEVMTETGEADIVIGTVEVSGSDITAAAAYYGSLVSQGAESKQEVAKLASRVKVYAEDDVLEADIQAIADNALKLYAEVQSSPKARNLSAA